MKRVIVGAIAASLLAGAAIARNASESTPGALERIEQSMARLEAKMSERQGGGGMMDGCRDMMGGGQPNEQWRSPDSKR